MKFINKMKNTIYLQDIDRYIPYLENDGIQEINADSILKSRGFQQLAAFGKLNIVEIGDSRIENNLFKLQSKMNSAREKLKKIARPENKENIIMESKPENVEVVIKGHFLEGGGYAKVNRNLAFGLDELGINTAVNVVGNGKLELTLEESKKINKLKSNKVTRNAICIDSIIPSFSNVSSGRKRILYTTIESYSVPKQFVESANLYDEIWVTSDFCAEVLKDSGFKKPIMVLPDSLDTNHYVPDGPAYEFKPSLKSFVFTSVFGWNYRKGYDVLLKAYLQEFSKEEDVSLLLVSKYQNNSKRSDVIKDEVNKFIKQYGGKDSPHIARCSRSIPESEMPSLYRASNAFVLFTRGEGFSLCYCEASLCGVPVIGTNCSGQTMFLNKENSYLLDIDRIAEVPAGRMNVHYWDGQRFPELISDKVISDARSIMREVYENYKEAKIKNEKLRTFLIENYSINNIAKKAKDRLEEIWRK